jgi:hypothetical protein
LTPVLASVPTALVVEAGTVGVRTYAAAQVGFGVEEFETDTVLRRGEHLVVDHGTVRTVRNAGPASAVVLVVAIEPAAVALTSPKMVAGAPGPRGFAGPPPTPRPSATATTASLPPRETAREGASSLRSWFHAGRRGRCGPSTGSPPLGASGWTPSPAASRHVERSRD